MDGDLTTLLRRTAAVPSEPIDPGRLRRTARRRRARRGATALVALVGLGLVAVPALDGLVGESTPDVAIDDTPPDVTSGLSLDPPEGGVVTVRTVEGTAVQIPAFELAAFSDGLYLLGRGSDGEYVDRRMVLSRDELQDLLGPSEVSGVWVRPGSTVADIQAVLRISPGGGIRGEHRLVTMLLSDSGAAATQITWEGEAQIVGSPFEFAAVWSPDGTSFAYRVHVVGEMWTRPGQDEFVVLDVDDGGRPTVAGRAPVEQGGLSFLAWVDGPADGFSLWTDMDTASGIGVTQWVREPDGSVERLDLGAPDEDGDVLATVEVPVDVEDLWRALLTTNAGEPLVRRARHGNAAIAIVPTADGGLDVAGLPPLRPEWAQDLYSVDWVD